MNKHKWKMFRVEEGEGHSFIIIDCNPENEEVLMYVSPADAEVMDDLINRHNKFVDNVTNNNPIFNTNMFIFHELLNAAKDCLENYNHDKLEAAVAKAEEINK